MFLGIKDKRRNITQCTFKKIIKTKKLRQREKTVPWSDELKCEILFARHGHHILKTNRERDSLDCYQHSLQYLHLGWYGGAYGIGCLHIWKGTISAKSYV